MIGNTVFFFDYNRRVYPKDERGLPTGAPIWREHWTPTVITGETSRSWITECGRKIPKNDRNLCAWAMSVEEIDRAEWAEFNAYRLSGTIQACRDFDKLKQIEAILSEGKS